MLESSFDDEYKRRNSNPDKTKSSKTSKRSTNHNEESKTSLAKSSKTLSQESESASNPLDETIDKLPYKRYHGFAFANPRSGDGLASRFLNDYPPKNIKQLYFADQKQ